MSPAASRRLTIAPSAVTYFFLVAAPTPERPLRSIDSTTVGVPPKSGSVTTSALTFAFPENETLSAPPVTTPVTGTSAEVLVVVVADEVDVDTVVLALSDVVLTVEVCAPAGAVHQNAALTARATESGTEENGNLRIMISLLRSRMRSAGSGWGRGRSRPAVPGSASAADAGTAPRCRRSPSAAAWRCPRARYCGS